MLIKKTDFKDLLIIEKNLFKDLRGHFHRDYCDKELSKINFKVKQTNISFNKKKFTLRGFHRQLPPFEERKIITCISGEILNISIDLRRKSKTYLKVFTVPTYTDSMKSTPKEKNQKTAIKSCFTSADTWIKRDWDCFGRLFFHFIRKTPCGNSIAWAQERSLMPD